MANRHKALMQDRARFKGAYLKALGDGGWVFNKKGKKRTSRWMF
jgi:hypothetical protein